MKQKRILTLVIALALSSLLLFLFLHPFAPRKAANTRRYSSIDLEAQKANLILLGSLRESREIRRTDDVICNYGVFSVSSVLKGILNENTVSTNLYKASDKEIRTCYAFNDGLDVPPSVGEKVIACFDVTKNKDISCGKIIAATPENILKVKNAVSKTDKEAISPRTDKADEKTQTSTDRK